MPRYHFEVTNDDAICEETEDEAYPSDEAALRGAQRLVVELSRENAELLGCSLTVVEEAGTTIGEFTLQPTQQLLQ